MAEQPAPTGDESGGTVEPSDPVLVSRDVWRSRAKLIQRLGYYLYGLAVVLFVVVLVTSPTDWAVRTIIGALVLGSIALAVGIQIQYAIRGAERHEEDARAQRRRR